MNQQPQMDHSLLALGPMSYPEIIAPDPWQPKPRTARGQEEIR